MFANKDPIYDDAAYWLSTSCSPDKAVFSLSMYFFSPRLLMFIFMSYEHRGYINGYFS